MLRRRLSPTLLVLTPIVAGALAVSSCSAEIDIETDGMPEVDTAAEAEAIMEIEREWSQKFGEGDLAYIMSIHADDAVQLPHNGEPIVGADALRAAWEGMIGAVDVSWEPVMANVSASGDMAWDYGTATMMTPDGAAVSMKYLVVWKKVDGEWKIAADMFNANASPQ